MSKRTKQSMSGFTLVELMIVVAILGVLSTIALYTYGRYMKKARASEVPEVFGVFKIREEYFHAEMGTYLGAPGGEGDFFPLAITSDRTAVPVKPAYWTQLGVKLSKSALYCQYSATAGPANDATNRGPIGAAQWPGAAVPTSDWFYLIAQCDLDGNPAVNSLYVQRGDESALIRTNEGK